MGRNRHYHEEGKINGTDRNYTAEPNQHKHPSQILHKPEIIGQFTSFISTGDCNLYRVEDARKLSHYNKE